MSSGAPHFIPRGDGDFDAWCRNLAEFWLATGPAYGVSAAEIGQLLNAIDDWQNTYPAQIAAQAQARAAARSKDDVRRSLEPLIRAAAGKVRAATAPTDPARAQMGLNLPGAAAAPAGAPTGTPLVSVRTTARLTHSIRMLDASTPERTALPRGVRGAEVWLALTDAAAPEPTNDDAYRFDRLITRGDFQRTFNAADGGKTAHYRIRWLGAGGERGAWASTAAATIAA